MFYQEFETVEQAIAKLDKRGLRKFFLEKAVDVSFSMDAPVIDKIYGRIVFKEGEVVTVVSTTGTISVYIDKGPGASQGRTWLLDGESTKKVREFFLDTVAKGDYGTREEYE